MAFCRWLAEKMKLDVQLPTEWQWERAARGRDGQAYPWGKEYRPGYANINEKFGNSGDHYLARTSPVGIYPQAASPDDILDLAGNVWEWCRNEYEHPERTGPNGSESRAMRGGSWVFTQDHARAGYRDRPCQLPPGFQSDHVGFRVVVVVSHPKRWTPGHRTLIRWGGDHRLNP